MSGQIWLSLMDYSAKYRVSISTLRRRIKAGELEFQFSDGKYLLRDATTAPSGSEIIAPPSQVKSQIQRPTEVRASAAPVSPVKTDAGAVELLLSEIKKAYALILQEKEEQILQLRSEVSDLKTLVRVLEDREEHQRPLLEPTLELDLDL